MRGLIVRYSGEFENLDVCKVSFQDKDDLLKQICNMPNLYKYIFIGDKHIEFFNEERDLTITAINELEKLKTLFEKDN